MATVRGEPLPSGSEWTVTLRRRRWTSPRPAVTDDGGRPALGSLGRFELLEELGRGGMGVVYEAYDRESRAVVALKTLVSMDAEDVFRLKHEFRMLANLEHENFVRLEELSSVGGHLFFTMERVRGDSFLRYVRPQAEGAAGGFDEARLRSALAQLVEALGALHAAGRIHRDVKPSNVLVTTQGRLVLLDFGLTSAFGRAAERLGRSRFTAPGQAGESGYGSSSDGIWGTPAYMAPEQLDGVALSPATDWYAVGVMLYTALTGELPFQGDLLDMIHAKQTVSSPVPSARTSPRTCARSASRCSGRSRRPGRASASSAPAWASPAPPSRPRRCSSAGSRSSSACAGRSRARAPRPRPWSSAASRGSGSRRWWSASSRG